MAGSARASTEDMKYTLGAAAAASYIIYAALVTLVLLESGDGWGLGAMGKPEGRLAPRNVRTLKIRKQRLRQATRQERETRSSISVGCINVNGLTDATVHDIRLAAELKSLDIMGVLETKLCAEDWRKKVSLPGFDCHEVRRSDADVDKNGKKIRNGGGIAVLTRKKAGLVFSVYSPRIQDKDLAYVQKERLWLCYDGGVGKTAICTLYLGYQSGTDKHGCWNDGIISVLEDEVHDLRSKGFRVLLQGDYNARCGNVLADLGIPGNDSRTNKNGERLKRFLRANGLTHLNGACRTPEDPSTRIGTVLWTRHGSGVPSSVLDYSVISNEHIASVVSFEVDSEGNLGGDSDHCMIITKLRDRFSVIETPGSPAREPGWRLQPDADWCGYRAVVHA